MRFTMAFIFVLFCALSSFIICVVWWVRWIRQRIIQKIGSGSGSAVEWLSISFRCHAFCWWVMQWWQRVNCSPIQTYWWNGYRRRSMYQMYWHCQYLLYCTSIGWIMEWSDICWIVWNELILIGVIRINVNWFKIFVIPNYRIFAPKFFNFVIIFALSIFENFVASKVFAFRFHSVMPRRSPVG